MQSTHAEAYAADLGFRLDEFEALLGLLDTEYERFVLRARAGLLTEMIDRAKQEKIAIKNRPLTVEETAEQLNWPIHTTASPSGGNRLGIVEIEQVARRKLKERHGMVRVLRT